MPSRLSPPVGPAGEILRLVEALEDAIRRQDDAQKGYHLAVLEILRADWMRRAEG